MKSYKITYECGTEEELKANSREELIEEVTDRVNAGAYGDDSCYVDVGVEEEGQDSEYITILYNSDQEEPDCVDDCDHDWESPEWLGGCTENPGVWSRGGTQISTREVCVRCGYYRDTVSESTPGQLPRTPKIIKYVEPDDASLKWSE